MKITALLFLAAADVVLSGEAYWCDGATAEKANAVCRASGGYVSPNVNGVCCNPPVVSSSYFLYDIKCGDAGGLTRVTSAGENDGC
ncbi:hypothetical protein TI39_contig278g00008 [Zymoseptoria brevis]|uniref:Uncharacterized protein n=1 Tax=Zymoseptoria brevis TaxID=1047168 RepID=A0A0F4H027_9PEZI|nr:hypothetical protein TI39_contig278g00008 [Zymoseptoria brevis]